MLKKVNLKNEVNSIPELFTYKHAGTLNDHMLNLLQAENRTLDFHTHPDSDEMFYCIEGEFDIETREGFTHIAEGDFIIVPKGTLHRPVCKGLCKCLLIEKKGHAKKRKYRRNIF